MVEGRFPPLQNVFRSGEFRDASHGSGRPKTIRRNGRKVGLAGEIRPVPNGQERLREAAKLGFKRALIAAANAPKSGVDGLDIHAVSRYSDVLDWFA